MRHAIRRLALTTLLLSLPAQAALEAKTLDKPLFAQVTLAQGNEKISGTLLKYDNDALTLRTGKGERELRWEQLTGQSQYALRAQLMDKKTADAWLELAELAMRNNLPDQAQAAVTQAIKIAPSSRLKGDAILRGQGAAKPATADTGGKPAAPAETARYQKPTPEEDAAALKAARAEAEDVKAKLKFKFAEFETTHFLVFTNWPQERLNFLRENLEGAYGAVSKQFNIPVTENIFVGKLPVYMFATQKDFQKFAEYDGGLPQAAGYYRGSSTGQGHMVMWMPDAKTWGPREADIVWARVLTHEFTHAFVARYRTNRFIPRWLNEGVAEVIAYGQFPDQSPYARALDMANKKFDFDAIFDPKTGMKADLYPVYHTFTEALVKDNHKAFLAMFDDIKDGMEAEAALKKHYKAGYKECEPAWRNYIKQQAGRR